MRGGNRKAEMKSWGGEAKILSKRGWGEKTGETLKPAFPDPVGVNANRKRRPLARVCGDCPLTRPWQDCVVPGDSPLSRFCFRRQTPSGWSSSVLGEVRRV